MNNDINIKIEPWKEITIKNYVIYKNIDEFIENEMPPEIVEDNNYGGILRWNNGIVFYAVPLSMDNDYSISKSIEEDRIYWLYLSMAPMKKYKRKIQEKDIYYLIVNSSNDKMIEKIMLRFKDMVKEE